MSHMVCVKNGAFHTIGHQWFLLDQTLRFEVKWHNWYSNQQRLSSQPVNARNPGIINSSNTVQFWNLLLLCTKCFNSRAQVGEMRQIMRTPLIKECGAIASLLPPADLWALMPQRVTWQSQGAPYLQLRWSKVREWSTWIRSIGYFQKVTATASGSEFYFDVLCLLPFDVHKGWPAL